MGDKHATYLVFLVKYFCCFINVATVDQTVMATILYHYVLVYHCVKCKRLQQCTEHSQREANIYILMAVCTYTCTSIHFFSCVTSWRDFRTPTPLGESAALKRYF